MTLQTITIRLPKTVYQRVQQHAQQKHRSIEDEVVAVVTAALPAIPELPDDITHDLAQMEFLTDDELWQAARITPTAKEAERMQALVWKRQQTGLTANETQEVEQLLTRYNRMMLVRAKAAVLLKTRGYDPAILLQEEGNSG